MDGFSQSLDVLFTKMENFVSTKTVVGEAVTIGDVVILPMIEVSVGVAAGSKEESGTKDGGAGGLGAKIIPSAVLVIHQGNVQLINIKNQDAVNKLIDMAPGIAAKLNFGAIFHKKDAEEKKPQEEVHFEESIVTEKD